MVQGKGIIDYPLFKTDYKGEDILVYRHPFFFVTEAVWNWYSEYSYYKDVTDVTPYNVRDPRYIDATRIYESELRKRTVRDVK